MVILNTSQRTVLADRCEAASTFFARLKGLQFRKELHKGSGLLLTPCNSIHMFFMRFPIDAVFIDAVNVIVHIEENIKPWRISKTVGKARSVLELPSGTVHATSTKIGDLIDIKN